MPNQPKLASTAFLISDPARAMMLMALVDGHPLPANELARIGGVTPQTASSHLAKLLSGGLVVVEVEGRHRYYRLAGPEVALALESLATVAAGPNRQRTPSNRERSWRFARCCYDHLAGQLGVVLTQVLEQRGLLVRGEGKEFVVTDAGAAWFCSIGVDVAQVRPSHVGLARQCLDWTERRLHLAGPLGAQLLACLCERRWLLRDKQSPVVHVTPKGWLALGSEFGLSRGHDGDIRLE